MGNTQFLKADFMPYGETSLAEQVSGAADLMQAAFAGVASAKTSAATGAANLSLLRHGRKYPSSTEQLHCMIPT